MLEERGLGETRSFTLPVPLKDAGLEETRGTIAGTAGRSRNRGDLETHREALLEEENRGNLAIRLEASLKDAIRGNSMNHRRHPEDEDPGKPGDSSQGEAKVEETGRPGDSVEATLKDAGFEETR